MARSSVQNVVVGVADIVVFVVEKVQRLVAQEGDGRMFREEVTERLGSRFLNASDHEIDVINRTPPLGDRA